jgi:hypothetical protein
VLDVWTQVHMKKVAEKGGKVKGKSISIKGLCEKHWDNHKDNCSGFVKAVAVELDERQLDLRSDDNYK